jgi:macrolide transport system ATP-binding/permease protein
MSASTALPNFAAAAAERLIEIRDLKRTYHLGDIDIHALRGANLLIERGEFIAIVGASGSGKSTLMNIIGCLDRPTSGKYVLDGIDVASLDEEQLAAIRSRRIGFVFQSFNLLSRTNAIENVELPLLYSGWTTEGGHHAHELLLMVGLAGRERNNPNQLSGGQQQRVAIARALVNHPSILLADEPTGNLDTQSSIEIMSLIQRLNRDQGLTVILVTHEADVAAFADRVVTFRDGVIVSETRNRPAAAASSTASAVLAPAPGLGAPRPEKEEAWSFAAMAIATAGRALGRNKMRSALTMLGIFIGVAAVIAMVAIGQGASASVRDQIASLGSNLIIVLPGATTANGVRAGFGSRSTLTVGDALAIQKEARSVALTGYVNRQAAQVVSATTNWSTNITGTTADHIEIADWPVARGRFFTGEEDHAAANLCVLGQTVANNLFAPGVDPVGQTVRIKAVLMRVIGVMSPKGQNNWGQDQDDVVFIPFQTAQRKVIGAAAANPVATSTAFYSTSPFNSTNVRTSVFGNVPKLNGMVNVIELKTSGSDLIQPAIDQVTQILHQRHRVQFNQDDDFTVRSLEDIAQAAQGAAQVMTMLLAAVASISLLVGGIGIMNILLVSVTERTREIGIRMAIGARRSHILLQFLVEALLLSLIGGLAGAILGIAASRLISSLAGWPTLVSPASILIAFLFSAAVGIFFGYYPARKASLLDPIDALRYE